MNDIPSNYIQCIWCESYVRLQNNDPTIEVKCPECSLVANPQPSDGKELVKKVVKKKEPVESRYRKQTIRTEPFSDVLSGQQVLGIDPGARYTGVVLRDNDTVLFSTTLVRPTDVEIGVWIPQVLRILEEIIDEHADENVILSVEGVSKPKGFKHGQRASLDPAHIMFTAAVFGGVVGKWNDVIIIEPGGNGSQHISQYPPALVNRRDKETARKSEVKTRNHERSAYDVAGKGIEVLRKANRI